MGVTVEPKAPPAGSTPDDGDGLAIEQNGLADDVRAGAELRGQSGWLRMRCRPIPSRAKPTYRWMDACRPSGIISTVAGNGTFGYSGDGGPATSAQLGGPSGVAVDSAGDLYIADSFDQVIRKVSASGIITTVAGTANQAGYSGDGAAATGAKLDYLSGVAVDSAGKPPAHN